MGFTTIYWIPMGGLCISLDSILEISDCFIDIRLFVQADTAILGNTTQAAKAGLGSIELRNCASE